ncbi:MAG: histone deacetylase family protein [Parahaliea sp.]
MTIAYINHPVFMLHEMGQHPERPERLSAICDRMIAGGLDMALIHEEAPKVNTDLLAAVHCPNYIQSLYDASPAEGYYHIDQDTMMNPHSLTAALHAAGAAERAVDMVMSGTVRQAFCAVRPPGHHAERNRAMGFCFFNNVAVGAYHALLNHGLERVAIVDFDVHHGNGTEDIVQGDERILFCSTFQHPFYPHTGIDCDATNVVNAPLPAGAIGSDFQQAVTTHWLPRLSAFAPELILVSAGFDAHKADLMANLNLVDSDYHWITRRICEQADTSAQGRVVSCLEGGYDLHSLARSVETHLKAMLGDY